MLWITQLGFRLRNTRQRDDLAVAWVAGEWVSVAAGLDQIGAGMGPQAEAGLTVALVLVGECLTRQRAGRNGVIFAGVGLLP